MNRDLQKTNKLVLERTNMARVLSVESDKNVIAEILDALSAPAHEVDIATTGRVGIAKVMSSDYDVVTLDLTLPDRDGMAILLTMRQIGIETPVLVIGSAHHVKTGIGALRAGGDDYMSIPFDREEMAARIEVLTRRNASRAPEGSRLRVGDLELDLITRRAQHRGRMVELHPTESRILEFLMRCPGQVLTRTMIFERVWGGPRVGAKNLIDVHISNLRKKVGTLKDGPLIRTIHGAGYLLG